MGETGKSLILGSYVFITFFVCIHTVIWVLWLLDLFLVSDDIQEAIMILTAFIVAFLATYGVWILHKVFGVLTYSPKSRINGGGD